MESKISKVKRLVIAKLDTNEDLLLSLTNLAKMHNITAGYFNVIGGLKKIAYGLYENGIYRNIIKEAKNCFELLPTFGNISIKNGEILIHCHIVAEDEVEDKSFGGHLIEGSKIFPFAEVFMHECDIELIRSYDQKTNLWPFKL